MAATLNAAGDLDLLGDIEVSGGNINTGNIALTIGDGTTDSVTVSTDSTGTDEVALHAGSIDGTEILNDTVDSDDYAAGSIDAASSDADSDRLLARAQAGVTPAPHLIVILEATSMAWHPVSLYLAAHGATLFRVNGRMTKEMRRGSSPHARSDRLDGQALAQLYTTCRDGSCGSRCPVARS